MQLQQLLVLLFALVALIPASLLTANSAYSFFKLQEQISNLYNGVLVIIIGLDDGHLSLLQMRSDVLAHILTTDPQQMQLFQDRIKQNERRFSDVLANYKEIGDFPLQVDIMKRRGLDNMTANDHAFITQVRVDWIQYQSIRDNLLSLSGQNRNSEAAALAFGQANTQFDKLIASYQKTVDLNKEIAKVLYEESNSVASTAYMYSVVVFVISLGIAIAVAIMLSKKLTSPIAEMQKRAKSDLDKFAAETSLVESHRKSLDSSSSSLKKNVAAQEGGNGKESFSDTAPPITLPGQIELRITTQEQKHFRETLSHNQLILLHTESYNTNLREALPHLSSKFLQSIIFSVNDLGNGKPGKSDAPTTGSKLVLITRAGSNLHRQVQHSGNAEIYLLSLSTPVPITKSADGLVVISLTNTSLIVEAVRHTLEKNPSSMIIFDNVTEFVHTIGFEKIHRFIQALNEVITSYRGVRLILLVNKHAHHPHEIQSIANMFNIFVQ